MDSILCLYNLSDHIHFALPHMSLLAWNSLETLFLWSAARTQIGGRYVKGNFSKLPRFYFLFFALVF